jgi:hypothetical protein
LASYVRSILSGNSAFDRFVNGDHSSLSPEEQRGLQVFRGKGNCSNCHVGPNFTDEALHNTGVAWDGKRFLDVGAGGGEFKTPTLREVSRTAPYMHDGSLATLEDVVDFYDQGGRPNPQLDRDIRPLRLTPDEKHALVAFLRTLSGDLISGSSGTSRISRPNPDASLTNSGPLTGELSSLAHCGDWRRYARTIIRVTHSAVAATHASVSPYIARGGKKGRHVIDTRRFRQCD